MKVTILVFSFLLLSSSTAAFAWAPTCGGGKGKSSALFASQANAAKAIDKKVALDGIGDGERYVYGPKGSTRTDLRKFDTYRSWIVKELNSESLLRAQLADTLDSANSPNAKAKFDYLTDADGISCRRQIFTDADVRLASFDEKNGEISVKFQVIIEISSRNEADAFGEDFEAKFIIQKDAAGISTQLSQYPSFVREENTDHQVLD